MYYVYQCIYKACVQQRYTRCTRFHASWVYVTGFGLSTHQHSSKLFQKYFLPLQQKKKKKL